MTADELDEVQQLADAGEHDAARERLRTIEFYPLPRSRIEPLARLYWQLGYAEMAGRLWYVTAASRPEVEQAIAAFERANGDHPRVVLDTLCEMPFGGTPGNERLKRLEQRVNALPRRNASPQTWRQWLTERAIFFGCATVLCLSIVLMVAGAMAIISELRR